MIVLILIGGTAQGAIISGKAIKVADGDTITILDVERRQQRIRIGGIDAPEKTQPFGDTGKPQPGALRARGTNAGLG